MTHSEPFSSKPPLDSANHFGLVKAENGFAMMSPPPPAKVFSGEWLLASAAWNFKLSGAKIEDFLRMVREIETK